jgi:L-seryl-tRNA(Ser) seleniumtransferase
MIPPDEDSRDLLRLIPQVNELADFVEKGRDGTVPRTLLVAAARSVCERVRDSILSRDASIGPSSLDTARLAAMVEDEAEKLTRPSLRRVVNATGVVLHTNLGRAPLPGGAIDAVRESCGAYSNLEYRLEAGERGSRQEHLEGLLTMLTGAEAALVVNNNAAAVLLALSALARGREVVVSRGQLVEIGDSFRLPDIMRQSGALLVEVGTTNITRLSDYANAIGPDTALLMRVHQSNYRIVGYSEEVSLGELVELGRQNSLPVVEDLGSGSMVDLEVEGLAGEQTVRESISRGADLVTFSGDKLLGGPQSGIVVGSKEYVEALRRHPLTRALRVDKMAVAALGATLVEYLDPSRARASIPTLRMLLEPEGAVRRRAMRLKRLLDRSAPAGLEYEVVSDSSRAGGGSLPTAAIATWCLGLSLSGASEKSLEESLRLSDPPVLARVRDERLLLDLRTVGDGEIPLLAAIIGNLPQR